MFRSPSCGSRSGQTELVIFLVLLLSALTLGAWSVWTFMAVRPIEVQRPAPGHHPRDCRLCAGSGWLVCPQCGGFGSLDATTTCPRCDGSGQERWRFRRHAKTPCPVCRGSGLVPDRIPCALCASTGKIPCGDPAPASLAIGTSRWERCLLHFGAAIPDNPRPQRDLFGAYPLVDRFLSLRHPDHTPHVAKWGRFELSGSTWRMTAQVEFWGPSDAVERKNIEFFVHHRSLAKSREIP